MAGGWYTREQVYDALKNPVIVHYAGGAIQRPWFTNCGSRYIDWYLKYKVLSPWKDVPLINRRKLENIKGFRLKTKDRLRLMSMRAETVLMSRILGKLSSLL